MVDFLVKMILYLLPMYVANSSALLFGGGKRLDFGKNLSDNKPLFGKSKTIKGTFSGIFAGIFTGLFLMVVFQETNYFNNYFLLATLLSIGAILGDIVASFFKRRLGFEEGREFLFLDQLDFLFGGMALGLLVYVPSLIEIISAILATFFVHKASNFIAFKLNLKKVPW